MPFTPIPARCKNCRKRFTKTQATKLFCSTKCRANFHNYGKTPLEQVTKRLKVWMKTPEFRELMREAVRKEVDQILSARTPSGQTVNEP
jgi:ribosomal protein L37AE/L43A